MRDGDDTVTFHTNLNTTHITNPPRTEHMCGAHPVLPTTPWRHTQHWIRSSSRRSGQRISLGGVKRAEAGGVVPAEWYCELTWPVRPLPEIETAAGGSWLVVAERAPRRGDGSGIWRRFLRGGAGTVGAGRRC